MKKIAEEIIHLEIIGLSGIVKLFHDPVCKKIAEGIIHLEIIGLSGIVSFSTILYVKR